ncbi:MAG TPA: dienelactone hydrolase family protein [Beijerinckiaceae bacterium]|jgi:carboxymethylenebutenolidase
MDQRIIALYDDYTHGGMNRRMFLNRLSLLAGGTAAAAALLPLLENNYARADILPETDPRISAETVDVPGMTGLKGYLVQPKTAGRRPAVLVIHENRGLNPHITDITRRVAAEGYLALGLDYLSTAGGTPTNEDRARDMIGQLSPDQALASSQAAIAYLKGRPDGTGKAGAIGFCWGGAAVNALAVSGAEFEAGVAYYGRQPPAEKVAAIRAPLLLHYAGLDQPVNAGVPAYEAALKAAGKPYELHLYEGANHAFNNDTNAARYDKAAADLAWRRTMDFFARHLGAAQPA